jgi:hypothetical protein
MPFDAHPAAAIAAIPRKPLLFNSISVFPFYVLKTKITCP